MRSSNAPGDREVAAFLTEIRSAYVTDPEEAVALRHLAAMAREAELMQPRHTPNPASWRRTMIRIAAATAAAVLGTAGLAAAGVDLPDQANDAFDKVGVTLPNQAGGGQSGEHSRSDDVHEVIGTTDPSERGCEFGHAVAEAANGERSLPPQAQDACENREEHGNSGDHANQSNHSQFGHDTAERAKDLGDATTEERQDFGQDTADQAKDLGGTQNQAREQNAPTGGTTGAPEGTPDGPPDTAPVPEDTPAGPPDGTPGGGRP
jgi:hypothetical protein